MKRATLVGVLSFIALSASAQPFRTFVSGNGSDSNPSCGVTSPCRTFAQAVSVVAAGGEVIALDTAGFGANLTISKSVSILIPDGIYGAITTATGDAITISAGSTDIVRIKGLNVIGNGTTGNGIFINTGGFVYVDGVTIRGFSSGDGIFSLANADVFVTSSSIRECNNGIGINLTSGGHKAVVTNSSIEHIVGDGIFVEGYGNVTVRDTIVSHANSAFYESSSVSMVTPELTLDHCLASYSNVGVNVNVGPSIVRMGACTVVDNGNGIVNTGGTLYSWSDNDVHGNPGGDVTGTITTVTKQ